MDFIHTENLTILWTELDLSHDPVPHQTSIPAWNIYPNIDFAWKTFFSSYRPSEKDHIFCENPIYIAISTCYNPNRSWPFFFQSFCLSVYDKQLFIVWKCDRDVGFTSEHIEDYISLNSCIQTGLYIYFQPTACKQTSYVSLSGQIILARLPAVLSPSISMNSHDLDGTPSSCVESLLLCTAEGYHRRYLSIPTEDF